MTKIEVSDAKPVVVLQSGERLNADLVIGADGFRSTLRSIVMPGVEPAYAGYVAWRGMIDEAAMSPALQRDLFPLFAFMLPPGEQMLGYPVPGSNNDLRSGHRRYTFVWYRPATGVALDQLLTDHQGRRHMMSIPPPLIQREVIDAMRKDAERLLPLSFQDIVRAADAPFVQPIYDLAVPQMVVGRCVLIGDAAFVARPHIGAGVTKAANDALGLAAHLDGADDIDLALRCFQSERLLEDHRLMRRGQWLGEAFLAPNPDHRVMLEQTANLRWTEPD